MTTLIDACGMLVESCFKAISLTFMVNRLRRRPLLDDEKVVDEVEEEGVDDDKGRARWRAHTTLG